MCVSETVWKGRLIRRCERLERPSFVFNALVRQVPALSTPPLSLLFFFSPRSSLPDTFFALTLERDSFIPTIACLLCFISLRNSWDRQELLSLLGGNTRRHVRIPAAVAETGQSHHRKLQPLRRFECQYLDTWAGEIQLLSRHKGGFDTPMCQFRCDSFPRLRRRTKNSAGSGAQPELACCRWQEAREQLYLFAATAYHPHDWRWSAVHIAALHLLVVKHAGRQVGLGRLANLSRRTVIHAQDTGAALELQAFMHVRPVEAAAIDGLVGIGSDEDAVGLIAHAHQQAQGAGIKVLSFVYHHRVIIQTYHTARDETLSLRPGLLPR